MYALVLIFSLAFLLMVHNAFYATRIPPKPFGE